MSPAPQRLRGPLPPAATAMALAKASSPNARLNFETRMIISSIGRVLIWTPRYSEPEISRPCSGGTRRPLFESSELAVPAPPSRCRAWLEVRGAGLGHAAFGGHCGLEARGRLICATPRSNGSSSPMRTARPAIWVGALLFATIAGLSGAQRRPGSGIFRRRRHQDCRSSGAGLDHPGRAGRHDQLSVRGPHQGRGTDRRRLARDRREGGWSS